MTEKKREWRIERFDLQAGMVHIHLLTPPWVPVTCKESEMCKESKMERLEKTWILELIGAALLAAMLGLWGWTANKVVQNGEKIVEVKAELQQEIAENGKRIAEVKAELGKEIAENGKRIAAIDAKLDLLISGLDIAVAPKDKAAKAEPSEG